MIEAKVVYMTKTREYQALLQACTQEGCPLCHLVQESTLRYLDSWKYELFTDVDLRNELRQTQGFCHSHTWQLVQMGATLPLAQAYRDIITDAIESIQQGNIPGPQSGLWQRFFESKRDTTPSTQCPACTVRSRAEERYIHSLRQALLEEEFCQRLQHSQGLCLNHYRLSCTLRLPETFGPWQTRLRQIQIHCLQRLDAQLKELIRKHDYRFKDEPRGIEMYSWLRAAGMVSGEKENKGYR